MPRGIKTGVIPPDEGMLKRIRQTEGRAAILPDKDELKRYIHKRMDEGHLSVNRCATELGIKRTALQTALTEGKSISYDFLARLLWIVDGEDCPYNIEQGVVDNSVEAKIARLGELFARHPDMRINEWDAENWIIAENGTERKWPKAHYSLYEAVWAFDKMNKGDATQL